MITLFFIRHLLRFMVHVLLPLWGYVDVNSSVSVSGPARGRAHWAVRMILVRPVG